jgi:hypothetical protein
MYHLLAEVRIFGVQSGVAAEKIGETCGLKDHGGTSFLVLEVLD